jgi:hypothetical protein
MRRILAVGRTGADDEHHFVTLAGENISNFSVPISLDSNQFRTHGIQFLNFFGNRELTFEFHVLHSYRLIFWECIYFTLVPW